MKSWYFILLISMAIFAIGVSAGQYNEKRFTSKTIKELQLENEELKDEIDILNANYQNIIYEMFLNYPVFVQDTLMESEDWYILREYNGDFHIFFKNINLGNVEWMYYKSDADRQEGADL